MATHAANSLQHRKFDSPAQAAFLHLWRTYDCLKAVEDELFAKFDISPQQYNALRLLDSVWPGAMPTLSLGKALISRNPDTTRLLDRLERREWVERERLADNRRVVEVRITKAGRQLLKRMAPEIVDMHTRQLGHLSRGDLSRLVKLLQAARRPHDDASCGWLDEEA